MNGIRRVRSVFSGFSFHSVSGGGALVLVNVGDEGCVGQCHDRVGICFVR